MAIVLGSVGPAAIGRSPGQAGLVVTGASANFQGQLLNLGAVTLRHCQ